VPPPGHRLERLVERHRLDTFTCGHVALDEWRRRHALTADRKGTARSYVWAGRADGVAAYFSLAPHLVVREEVPDKVGRGSPRQIPAVLLARLALSERLHGQGYGAMLLVEALGVAVNAIRRSGGRLIVVDAIDTRAAGSYERHGFVRMAVPGRLVMKASDAAASLSLLWP